MYSTTDFRKGLKIEVEGTPYEIVDFQHFKPGKGGAMVRTKLRNILTGRIQDITFRSGEKVGKPDLETRDMQFLYRQDDELIFMDMTTYEQMQMAVASTGGKEGFLKDGQECRVLLYKGSPLDIDIPLTLILEVSETEPGRQRRYDEQRHQAGQGLNRSPGPGTYFRKYRRQNQGGYAHQGILGQGMKTRACSRTAHAACPP